MLIFLFVNRHDKNDDSSLEKVASSSLYELCKRRSKRIDWTISGYYKMKRKMTEGTR